MLFEPMRFFEGSALSILSLRYPLLQTVSAQVSNKWNVM
jgi:hypothetical protein